MDHKELGTNSPVSTSISDGGTKFGLSTPTVQSSRNKSYDVGSISLGKVDATATRPCAIIGPDRVLPPNPDDTIYLKKVPGEVWAPENIYRRLPEYPSKISDCQPTRNISPRQTFQENMQRIMVPPTFSSMKNDETNMKNTKPTTNMPQEVKYCDVPYNVNTVNSEHKSAKNSDIPMSNVNPYQRNMPPPYGWPVGVNVRPLRPYGAPEFYPYQDFPSCAGPRPMTMMRPHRALHEESGHVYSERLYQDANIRFKPYPTGKEKHQQPRYDYINNYPSTFHPPPSIPPHKYDLQKPIHGHPYPVYPPVPFKYLDRRIHEPFVDGYHRSHNQQANFNAFHNQIPPPYGPVPGNCMQNKSYSEALSKPTNTNKMQFENNNKVYLNLEPRNKNYSVPENVYYNDINYSQAMRGEISLPSHSTVPIHPVSQHSIYRKDNTSVKSHDYSPNYRVYDHVNQSLQRIPFHFSPNTISPSDSNTSNDTAHTIGTSHEDCGYVSQSSTTSIRSIDSSNIPIPHEMYRRPSYNNYDMFQNSFHSNGPITKSKSRASNNKNLDVRQFLQMWNEGDEEVSEGNKEATTQNHAKKFSQNEIIDNQEQLYVLGLVDVPNEELGKYDHIQKISKLPENIKGYNSLEILNQYEKLLETPHINNYNKSRNYNNSLSKNLTEKEFNTKLPRPLSPLDVEAKISQSVIHKEVGCNFEIKPCSPKMLNVEIAAPVQNILGERMIEKVVNPILTKTPSLTRSNNNKSQNIVNEVKVASCKMISDPYSIKSSPNRLKASNYSVQDMESNTGLCLSSLPQLDNDIELNFPEINQQFIKANQIESNVQSLLHTELQQTHHCLPHEIKDDCLQSNTSPHLSLSSVGDKESSKLSKYRKCKKIELSASTNVSQQGAIKPGETIAAFQRIDSVIIKNPDTIKSQYNDFVKTGESTHDLRTESKQCSMDFESNMNTCDLSSDTAIDFSLNRSEDETNVGYLNVTNRNNSRNLPPLEGFDEDILSKETDVLIATENIQIPNTSEHFHVVSSNEEINKVQGEHFKINEECNDKNQDTDENKFCLTNFPEKSHKDNENQEYNVLVMKKLDQPEISAINNIASIESTRNVDSPAVDIKNVNNSDEKSNQNKLLLNMTDIVISKYKTDTEKVVPESDEENKIEVDVQNSTIESIMGDEGQFNYEKSTIDIENEKASNVVSENSFYVKSENDYDFENNAKKNLTDNQITGEMVGDSFNRDFGNLNNIISNAINDSENFTALDDSQKKEQVDSESCISLVNQFHTIAEKSHSDIINDECCLHVGQSVPSEPNKNSKVFIKNTELSEVKSPEVSENQIISTELDLTLSNSEIMASIETKSNPTDFTVEISECLQQSSKTDTNTADFESSIKNLLKNNDLDNSSGTFSVTLEMAHSDCESKLDVCDFECLSKEYEVKICDLKSETSNLESKISSSPELTECGEEIETFSIVKLQKKNDKSNICMEESPSLCSKADMCTDTVKELCSFVNQTSPENPKSINNDCKNEIKIENHIKTSTIQSNCLSNKFCLKDNSGEESSLFTENMICSENTIVKTSGITIETEINIADSGIMSDETCLTLNNKINDEKSIVTSKEYKPEIELKDSIPTDSIMKVEKSILSLSSDEITHTETSTAKTTECSQIAEKIDNDLKKVVDIINMAPCSNNLDHNSNTSFERITLPSLHPVIKKDCMFFKKALFSPWIQKLITLTEGACISVKNSNYSQENKDFSFVDTTILQKNDKMDVFHSWSRKTNYELCNIDKESNLFYESDRGVINCTSQKEQGEIQFIELDNNTLNSIHETKSEHSGVITSECNKSYDIKPRKISKRSLSESALETFQCIDDVNCMHPCKRKKGLKGEQSFLDSQIITEDICNIIQTNRRNSISTFYNEDNVYIVIDNDLILAEENGDSEKICYTESAEEYLTTLESTNEVNLNLEPDSYIDGPNQIKEYPDSVPHIQEKYLEDSWVDDVACMETVFSEDVAENIVIDLLPSPKEADSPDYEIDSEESMVFCDSDHLDKIKSIYGRNICNDNNQLIETLYRTPQMDVNKTLYHIESRDPKDCLDDIIESCLQSTEIVKTENVSILNTDISTNKVVGNKENMSENLSFNCKQYNQNVYSNYNHSSQSKDLSTEEEGILTEESSQEIYIMSEEQQDKTTTHSCKSSNDDITTNVLKESYSCSSSPEVSSTTSEENSSSILLKITNCNGSRVSQINQINTDSCNKLSYKLTEKGEYRSYNSNFNSSRKLITKAAQKYIPPLKEIYDLKVKLPLPQHRLHTLKQLKVAKIVQKMSTSNDCTVKRLNCEISKKPKPKFEDVLKSIDEINFKRLKDNTKKGKIAIPKVIIKKNENGAHYASSKSALSKETYNPDLTGRKWQPWVFLEKNNFVDKMALQNKVKAVFCHRKNSYVLSEKFRKYKSIYNANFIITQPKTDMKGNLKYTIRLKPIH